MWRGLYGGKRPIASIEKNLGKVEITPLKELSSTERRNSLDSARATFHDCATSWLRKLECVMKIALMTHDTRLYSTRRLIEAARERGHDINPVKTFQTVVKVTPGKPVLIHDGHPLEGFDAVIPRIGNSITWFGTSVLRQFELMGAVPLNSSDAILCSRDKLRAIQLLSQAGVPVPVTASTIDPAHSQGLIALADGPPVVVKPIEGAEGEGVILLETPEDAGQHIRTCIEAKTDVLAQHFYEEARGTDIRAIVAGGEVIAAIRRTGSDGEFRSNLHRGGTAKVTELTSKENELAIRASQVLGLNASGVDILRTKNGPVVLEVNSTPGIEGIENATGVDAAGSFIGSLEELVAYKKAAALATA